MVPHCRAFLQVFLVITAKNAVICTFLSNNTQIANIRLGTENVQTENFSDIFLSERLFVRTSQDGSNFLSLWMKYLSVTIPNESYWEVLPAVEFIMKWCELREYKWNEYVTIAVNRNLSNCEKARKKKKGRKKGFRGFNGIRTRGLCVSAAVLYQPELWRPICWRPANLLSSSTRERNETQNEMMWTAGIQMKWVCDHRSESQLKQLRKRPKKGWSHTQIRSP